MTFPPNPQGQQGWPQQASQQQAQGYMQQGQQGMPPQPVTQSAEAWFGEQQARSGGGAPSFAFANIGDTVQGEIVHMEGRQRTRMEDGQLLFFKDGTPQMQLVVTLQTELRGWQQVVTVPTVTDPQGNKVPLGPEHDDGKRRIYVWYTLKEAFMNALQQAGVGSPNVGDLLAVRFSGTRPNPKVQNGKPSKEYQVMYRAGNPAAQQFMAQEQAQAAPAPQAPPSQGYQPQPSQVGGQPNPAYAPQQPQQAPPPQAPPQQQAPPAPPQQGGFNPADAGPPPF